MENSEMLAIRPKAWKLGIVGGIIGWSKGEVETITRSLDYFYDIATETQKSLEEFWTPQEFEILKLVGLVVLSDEIVEKMQLKKNCVCFRECEDIETIHRTNDPLPRSRRTWKFNSEKFFQLLKEL